MLSSLKLTLTMTDESGEEVVIEESISMPLSRIQSDEPVKLLIYTIREKLRNLGERS